ncbi:hypothetical protein AU468_12290 [Alkalispirochaeta sphaeroplastigenens]|uniref:Uncharacterized protein n=1 Tax=Alkalispirochaeta sphaeroplastigenens TaxID=1187066 RepID=A0A2S4JGY9_9SPIO|nr:hypothetical protein [Alkalispirochaeta sphaeroplastigenens]POQ98812.1 hypothetical protein AU468_12290 [Alkalispirochaeta sphaeroplastigenens]
MEHFFDQIPETVQEHLRRITATSGLPDTEESLERMARAWLEKKTLFEQRQEEHGLSQVSLFGADEARGALVLTYSGSLITVGPLTGEGRRVEYTSIGLRQDVPDAATADATALTDDLALDKLASFSQGPIHTSSALFAIALIEEEMDPEEEQQVLTGVTRVLAEDFVEVNKTLLRG